MAIFSTQLVIEGIEIDLFDNFDGSITYAVSNIQNIGNITSNYSKTITVPGSSQNNKAFNYLFDVKASNDNSDPAKSNIGSNFDFKRKARAYVLQDQQVILHGYAQLISASTIKGVVSFELQISSDLTGLVSDLGDGRLEDLFDSGSSTPFDHKLTLKNITGSWNQSGSDAADAAGLPFLYPIIDYGDYDTLQGVNFYSQTLRPCLFAKKYFDLCLESASYSYDSAFLSGSYFQSMVIPYKDGQLGVSTSDLVFSDALNSASLVITQSNNYNTAPVFVYNQDDLPLYSGSRFTPNQGALYNFSVNINYNLHLHVVYTGSTAVQYFNNTPISIFAYIPLFDNVTNALVNGTNYIQYTLAEGTIPIAPSFRDLTSNDNSITLHGNFYIPLGQYAKVGVSVNNFYIDSAFIGVTYADGTKGYLPGSGSIDINPVSSTDLSINFQGNLDGQTLTYNQFVLKDVKQIDYVTSILQLFNLYAVPDKDQPRRFNIFTYDEFYHNEKPVLDWTNKIDQDQEIKITPIPQLSSQNILLSSRPDQDWYNTLYTSIYGNGVYGQLRASTGYSFNTSTLDVLSSNIFSPTVPVQYKQEYQPSEVLCEILTGSRDTIQVTGYYSQVSGSAVTSSAQLQTSGIFSKAREGGYINFWGKLVKIVKVINPSQFKVTDLTGSAIQLTRPGGATGGPYYATNDPFQYIGDNNKIFPAIYSTSDQNNTRQPIAVNPRILYYQGLQPCNNWTLQYTPQPSETSLTASYFQIPYKVTQSVYPAVSHLDNYTNPTRDLLFEEPNNTFFPVTGQYPTQSLFTSFWQNYLLQITDEDAKLLSANFKLSSIDVSNLTLNETINVNGTYFKINQIIDYSPDDSTTTQVELLRSPFQIYPGNPSSGSAALSNLSASLNNLASSSINNITINGSSIIILTGSSFPLTAGQGNLSVIAPTSSANVVVSLSSSISTDVISITDGVNTFSQPIAFGSSIVSSSKSFFADNTVFISVSGSVHNLSFLTASVNALATSSINVITVNTETASFISGNNLHISHSGAGLFSYDYIFPLNENDVTILYSGTPNETITLKDTNNSASNFLIPSLGIGSHTFHSQVIANGGIVSLNISQSIVTPVTASMTLTYTKGTWTATLDKVLNGDFSFSSGSAQGYISGDCSGAIFRTDSTGTILIHSGSLSASAHTAGFDCLVSTYHLSNGILISGSRINSGSTITNGIDKVKISINPIFCSSYTCS